MASRDSRGRIYSISSATYFNETSLLHQFAERCPEAEAAFRDLIRSKTAEYRQGLKQMREDADAFIERLEQQEANIPFDPTLLRDEIERQRRDTTDREPVARQMAEVIRKALKMSGTLRDDVQKADRHGLLDRIFAASWREGFALTREAWKAIEREATVDELRCLTILARTSDGITRSVAADGGVGYAVGVIHHSPGSRYPAHPGSPATKEGVP